MNKKFKIKKIIYSASSSCYGIPKKFPTPEESKMTMKHKPYVPSIMDENKTLNKAWIDYQESFVY